MVQKIKILENEYEIIDAKEKMTVPDCFVIKNKIGVGHGEAKFYVGNDNKETRTFFDNFNRNFFILKSDLISYLNEAKVEYKSPQQPYQNKSKLSHDWDVYWDKLNSFSKEILFFNVKEQTQIEGSRIYINSNDEIYKFIRQISLPNITYISSLKLKDSNGEILYYFRLFLDYFGEEEHPVLINEKIKEINESKKIKNLEKDQIVKSRIGQGIYRQKLLIECPLCPITLITDDRLLIASHIKPWARSENFEKIDPKNGFMFTPTYDFLFDRGFISFTDNKTIIISPWLSKMTISKLNLVPDKKYIHLPIEGRHKYLEFHRRFIFKK